MRGPKRIKKVVKVRIRVEGQVIYARGKSVKIRCH